MSVEEQQEMVVGDPPANRIEFGDGVTVEKDHQAAGESRIPIGLIHLGGVGLEPQDVTELAPAAVFGVTGEEPPPPQYRMGLAQPRSPQR